MLIRFCYCSTSFNNSTVFTLQTVANNRITFQIFWNMISIRPDLKMNPKILFKPKPTHCCHQSHDGLYSRHKFDKTNDFTCILPTYVISFCFSVATTSKFKLNKVFPFSPLSLKTFNQGIKWYISKIPYLQSQIFTLWLVFDKKRFKICWWYNRLQYLKYRYKLGKIKHNYIRWLSF